MYGMFLCLLHDAGLIAVADICLSKLCRTYFGSHRIEGCMKCTFENSEGQLFSSELISWLTF